MGSLLRRTGSPFDPKTTCDLLCPGGMTFSNWLATLIGQKVCSLNHDDLVMYQCNGNHVIIGYSRNAFTCCLQDGSHLFRYQCVNSLWPSDSIWRQRSGTTLAQVMACCLMVPSHYLNQCWLTISMVQWHSYEGSFTRDTSAIDH